MQEEAPQNGVLINDNFVNKYHHKKFATIVPDRNTVTRPLRQGKIGNHEIDNIKAR